MNHTWKYTHKLTDRIDKILNSFLILFKQQATEKYFLNIKIKSWKIEIYFKIISIW